jgi:hypothetical protein
VTDVFANDDDRQMMPLSMQSTTAIERANYRACAAMAWTLPLSVSHALARHSIGMTGEGKLQGESKILFAVELRWLDGER